MEKTEEKNKKPGTVVKIIGKHYRVEGKHWTDIIRLKEKNGFIKYIVK